MFREAEYVTLAESQLESYHDVELVKHHQLKTIHDDE